MAAKVHQFMCLQDNFGVLVHDPDTGATASMDVPEAAPVLAALEATGWTLTDILVTHHHNDHIGGIPAVKEKFPNARIVAAKKDEARIPGADVYVAESERVKVGNLTARIIETPGHTSGHIGDFFEEDRLLFAGDTLFALGCGLAFEAPPPVLHQSLQKIAALPADTQIFCGHEYTLSNARFSLTVDPENAKLRDRFATIQTLRDAGKPTLPTTLAVELETNPFLRPGDAGIRKQLGMANADDAAVFTELRERKNKA